MLSGLELGVIMIGFPLVAFLTQLIVCLVERRKELNHGADKEWPKRLMAQEMGRFLLIVSIQMSKVIYGVVEFILLLNVFHILDGTIPFGLFAVDDMTGMLARICGIAGALAILLSFMLMLRAIRKGLSYLDQAEFTRLILMNAITEVPCVIALFVFLLRILG